MSGHLERAHRRGSLALSGLVLAFLCALWTSDLRARPVGSGGLSGLEQQALRRHLAGQLEGAAELRLAHDPDDADGMALLGVAHDLAGWHGLALGELELALGNAVPVSVRHHASALRYTGQGVAAATLREALLVSLDDDGATSLLASQVDDLRLSMAWPEALDAADRLLAHAPGSALAHATVAHLYWELGHPDAQWHAVVAEWTDADHPRLLELSIRVALAEDRGSAALAAAERLRAQRRKDPTTWALLTRSLCAAGRTERGLDVVALPRFAGHGHPELRAAEVHCLVAAQRGAEACGVLADLDTLAPRLRSTRMAHSIAEPCP